MNKSGCVELKIISRVPELLPTSQLALDTSSAPNERDHTFEQFGNVLHEEYQFEQTTPYVKKKLRRLPSSLPKLRQNMNDL